MFVFIFTVVAGAASIFSTFFSTPSSSDLDQKVEALEKVARETGQSSAQLHSDLEQLASILGKEIQSLQADIPLDSKGLSLRIQDTKGLTANVDKTLHALEDPRAVQRSNEEIRLLKLQIIEMQNTILAIKNNSELAREFVKQGKTDQLLDLELPGAGQEIAVGKIEVQGTGPGSIENSDLRPDSTTRIYLSNQREEFVRDAKAAAKESVPRYIRSREINADLSCSGPPGGCRWIELEQPAKTWETSRLMKIRWHVERNGLHKASSLTGLSRTALESSFKSSGLSLCGWYYLMMLSAGSSPMLPNDRTLRLNKFNHYETPGGLLRWSPRLIGGRWGA